jgi:ferredoxin
LEEIEMKVTVTKDCITSELCVATCPAVFEIDHTIGRARVKKQPALEEEALVRKAAEDCPSVAIVVEE